MLEHMFRGEAPIRPGASRRRVSQSWLVWVDEHSARDVQNVFGYLTRQANSYSLEMFEPTPSQVNYRFVFYPSGRWVVPLSQRLQQRNEPDYKRYVRGTIGKRGGMKINEGYLDINEVGLLEAMVSRYIELATAAA